MEREALALAETLKHFAGAMTRLREALGRVIVGQEAVLEQLLVGLLAGGHVLLEGVPGVAKTLMARALAAALELTFARIQFTPDLMPADITGTNILEEGEGGQRRFRFQPGPIFAHLVLADEINRATPKTQSALLEAMQEEAVTVAGERHPLLPPFMVIATQNPIEMEGTYPLPEAQLDRFLLKVEVPSPSPAELVAVVERTTGPPPSLPDPVLRREEVLSYRRLVREVPAAPAVVRYAAALVGRAHPGPDAPTEVRRYVRYGPSPRGAQALVLGAKALALLRGRCHVVPADVRTLVGPALRHRLLLTFDAEVDGVSPDRVLAAVVEATPEVPPEVEELLRE